MSFTTYGSITLTASGSVNTKGSYSQIAASTPYNSSRMFLSFGSGSQSAQLLVDIATGAAASEVVIAANILVDVDTAGVAAIFIPIQADIPAGTRLSARCQSNTSSGVIGLDVHLQNRGLATISAPVTYGANTAASNGTTVDPGGTINTKSAYVQLTASSTAAIETLIVCVMAADSGFSAGIRWLIDIATGAAASETIVIPNISFIADAVADAMFPKARYFSISIPASTRIAVRASCTSNSATLRVITVSVIGMQDGTPVSSGGAAAFAYVG